MSTAGENAQTARMAWAKAYNHLHIAISCCWPEMLLWCDNHELLQPWSLVVQEDPTRREARRKRMMGVGQRLETYVRKLRMPPSLAWGESMSMRSEIAVELGNLVKKIRQDHNWASQNAPNLSPLPPFDVEELVNFMLEKRQLLHRWIESQPPPIWTQTLLRRLSRDEDVLASIVQLPCATLEEMIEVWRSLINLQRAIVGETTLLKSFRDQGSLSPEMAMSITIEFFS